MNRPECFESEEQWREWALLADFTKIPRRRFCIDCTPDYRDRMASLSRCAHPETVFVKDQAGATVGITSQERGWLAVVTGQCPNSGVMSSRKVVAVASPEAILAELKKRRTA